MRVRYIDMDLNDALELKYQEGMKKHRKQASDKFQNDDVAEELFQELLDAIHYTIELESRGPQLPGFRTTLKNMAMNLQQRRKELTPR